MAPSLRATSDSRWTGYTVVTNPVDGSELVNVTNPDPLGHSKPSNAGVDPRSTSGGILGMAKK